MRYEDAERVKGKTEVDDFHPGGVILVSIKRVFTDFDIDCEYAIVLSYRMVRGDHMIAQMWEPHQTSAFLNAFFIAIYLWVTGTTTGIALYLNIVGLMVKLGVAYIFYRTFSRFCDRTILFLMTAFFLTVNAKESIILEFSNMMIYFSILLLCALVMHLQSQKSQETIFLVLSALSFCLEVLSYPSTIILFPLILAILYHYSGTKGRDIIICTLICVCIGSAFLLFLVMQTGWSRFWECVSIIIMGDSTHKMGDIAGKLSVYGTGIKDVGILFAICAFLSLLAVRLFRRKRADGAVNASFKENEGAGFLKIYYVRAFFMMLLLGNLMQALSDVKKVELVQKIRVLYSAIYLPVSFLAFRLRRYCNKEERMAFQIGIGISLAGCVAVLLLTNLSFMNTLAYLIPGVMVSMIPIGEYLYRNLPDTKNTRRYGMLILFVCVFIFQNIYVLRPMSRPNVKIWSVRGVVKSGPMVGIFSDYMGPYIMNSNLNDWKQYVRKGDRVLLVGGNTLSTIGYLYEDTEICVHSTICTPTYDEKLLSYWEMNPWKEPNVVVLDCWFGEPRVSGDEWIMQWIEEHFDTYEDGRYVRVYRRE